MLENVQDFERLMMRRVTYWLLASFSGFATLALGCVLFVGCSKSENAAGSGENAAAAAPPTDPAARVAYDFLDAVLKGDDQRVSASLTPLAMQRLVASGQRFSLPGVESTTFSVGEVRKPSESQAFVQCLLSEKSKSKPGEEVKEEICCLVRQVEANWRVCGIAFTTSPGRPPTIIDFEAPPLEPMGMPVAPQATTLPEQPGLPQRPSPPRTAEETPVPSYR